MDELMFDMLEENHGHEHMDEKWKMEHLMRMMNNENRKERRETC